MARATEFDASLALARTLASSTGALTTACCSTSPARPLAESVALRDDIEENGTARDALGARGQAKV